jgi:uncharacterized small protein (DUF1192 family)
MSPTVNTKTGEILDAADFMTALPELDARIAAEDDEIGRLRENLKLARRHREGLVAELRAAARGDRALPFIEDPPKE